MCWKLLWDMAAQSEEPYKSRLANAIMCTWLIEITPFGNYKAGLVNNIKKKCFRLAIGYRRIQHYNQRNSYKSTYRRAVRRKANFEDPDEENPISREKR